VSPPAIRLPYEIEADFCLLTTCNFRCAYCFLREEQLGAKVQRYASNERWSEAFDATGLTWMIHITGGEPFVYPEFVDLCVRLSARHYLSINSNLSHRSVVDFAARIDPGRVHYINAALHYDERARADRMETFVRHVDALRRARVPVMVSVVMTPACIERFPALKAELEPLGLPLFPKVMYGRFEGRVYPAAYSREERSLLLRYCAQARADHADLAGEMRETPTIDLFHEDAMLLAADDFRGQLCGSGSTFVAITSDGAALRCGSGRRLGNLLEGNLRLSPEPSTCDTSYCTYFCHKYTSPPFRRPPATAT
jgi:MoaA/NifB/PqqE/SkfB family radical SAM enzyme